MQITKCDSCGKVVKNDFETFNMSHFGRKDSFRFEICEKCAAPLQKFIKGLKRKQEHLKKRAR